MVGYTDESGVTLPPLHPRCRCAIMYREVGVPRVMQPKPSKPPSDTSQGQRDFFIPNLNPRPLKSIGVRHYATVQIILANAPNHKAAEVWAKFENKVRIGAIDRGKTAVHFNGAIYFNINEVMRGDVINEPYQLLFHEGAHNIDHALAKNGQNLSEYYGDEALLKAIEKDFAKLMPNIAVLKNNWIREYGLKERALLSDLLGLYSDGEHHLGTGHDRKYWLEGGRPRKSHEAFAIFMEASLANAPAYKILSRHLPTAAKIFNVMMEDLLK